MSGLCMVQHRKNELDVLLKSTISAACVSFVLIENKEE